VQTEFSTPTTPVGPPPPPTTSASFSPDGRLLVTARGRTVSVREWRTGRVLDSLEQRETVSTAAFDSTGRLVVTAGRDGIARVWRPGGSETPVELRPNGARAAQPLSSAGFGGPGDGLVVTAGGRSPVRVWSWRNARVLGELPARGRRQFRTAAFGPDGTTVVAAGNNGIAYVWHWRAKPISVVRLGSADVPLSGAAFSPDGSLVVTGSEDATVRIWAWRRRKQVGSSLRSQIQTQVATVGFSPDGRRILTASADGIARIWSLSNPDSLVVLRQSGRQPVPLFSAAFSGNGALVATASERGTAVWYPAAKNGPIQCAGLGAQKGDRERCPY
jgi:WD40 repeat protein